MESDTRKRRCRLGVGAVALVVLALASSVWADDLIVDGGKTLEVTTDIHYGHEYIGGSGGGTLNQYSGTTNTVDWNLYIGCGSTGQGNYILNGGTLSVFYESIGGIEFPPSSGIGVFGQHGGTHTVQNWIRVGDTSGSTGTYVMDGGSLSAWYLDIGNSGNGIFFHSGAATTTVTLENFLTVGVNSGSTGSYFLNGGSLSGKIEQIGKDGTGIFFHEKGTNTSTTLTLGSNPGSSGTYTMYDGSLSVSAGDLIIGGKGTGSFTQSLSAIQTGTGGSVNVTNAVKIGADPLGTGIYTMDKGTLTTKDLTVGSTGLPSDPITGTLHLTSKEATITVSGAFTINARGQFYGNENKKGGTIILTGANVYIRSNHVDMSNTTLIFANPTAKDKLDVGVSNFRLGELDLIGGAMLTLFGKGFYVDTLNLGVGSSLNLNNLPLYLFNGVGYDLVKAGDFDGRIVNTPVPVPVPGLILLLGTGLLGLGGWRRFRKG